jgi:hypothetical protein
MATLVTTLCRYLRWKSFHGAEWDTVEDLARHHVEHRSSYSCLRSGHPWGPDGEAATPECCTESRACFTLSPRMPSPQPFSARLWQRIVQLFWPRAE